MQRCSDNPRGMILTATRELVRSEGLEQINMRAVARLCGVSVGTLYNTFPTKNDLLMAVVEDFWAGALADFDSSPTGGEDLCSRVDGLYRRLSASLTRFSTDWLGQLSRLHGGDMARARQKELAFFDRIRGELARLLESDPDLPTGVWVGCFTPAKLAEVLFGAMLSMLRRGETDTAFLLEALRRLLRSPAILNGSKGEE